MSWDRTFTTPPTPCESEEIPSNLLEALAKLARDEAEGRAQLVRVGLVRKLRSVSNRRAWDSSYTSAASYTVSDSWCDVDLAQAIIGAARAARLEDDGPRQTSLWGAKFYIEQNGKRSTADPGSAYFDLDELPTQPESGPTPPPVTIERVLQRELDRRGDEVASERRYWRTELAQQRQHYERQLAELSARYEERVAKLTDDFREGLRAERERCDSEITNKSKLVVEHSEQVVSLAIKGHAQATEQVDQLHGRLDTHHQRSADLTRDLLDPKNSMAAASISMMATGASLIERTFKERIDAAEAAAADAEKERRSKFMESALKEMTKLGRSWLRTKGVEIEGEDEPITLEAAFRRLIAGASDEDWAQLDKLAPEISARLREVEANWDESAAVELLEVVLDEAAAANVGLETFSVATQRNLQAVVEAS